MGDDEDKLVRGIPLHMDMNQRLEIVREHAPNLVVLFATFQPFIDALFDVSICRKPDGEVYLCLDVDDPRLSETMDEVRQLWVSADEVLLVSTVTTGGGDDITSRNLLPIDLAWDYLRQLPRTYKYFARYGRWVNG